MNLTIRPITTKEQPMNTQSITAASTELSSLNESAKRVFGSDTHIVLDGDAIKIYGRRREKVVIGMAIAFVRAGQKMHVSAGADANGKKFELITYR